MHDQELPTRQRAVGRSENPGWGEGVSSNLVAPPPPKPDEIGLHNISAKNWGGGLPLRFRRPWDS